MNLLAKVVILFGVFFVGITATVALANPEEACKKWPNNKQCPPPTTTDYEPPPTTTEEEPPPPTTTEEEPPPTTTEEETPPPSPPNSGGTTGGSEPPPVNTSLPLTGLDAGWLAVIGLCLIGSGVILLLWGRPGGGPWKKTI